MKGIGRRPGNGYLAKWGRRSGKQVCGLAGATVTGRPLDMDRNGRMENTWDLLPLGKASQDAATREEDCECREDEKKSKYSC